MSAPSASRVPPAMSRRRRRLTTAAATLSFLVGAFALGALADEGTTTSAPADPAASHAADGSGSGAGDGTPTPSASTSTDADASAPSTSAPPSTAVPGESSSTSASTPSPSATSPASASTPPPAAPPAATVAASAPPAEASETQSDWPDDPSDDLATTPPTTPEPGPGPYDGITSRPITFPVAGPVVYYEDFGACRGGPACPRHHEGNDVLGVRLQPLRATVDGHVTKFIHGALPGNGIAIADADGWVYVYLHLNDDPVTADGAVWTYAPGITVGTEVKAGQLIGYLGDSGNAEGTPHLHFEIRRPDGLPIDPRASLLAAEEREHCPSQWQRAALSTFLLATAPPADATTVTTSTGAGAFSLTGDGGSYATGDALEIGRQFAWLPACPAAP